MSTDLQISPIQAAFNRGLWVADLRSGRFTQTPNRLQDVGGYCCLGVGGETAARATNGEVCHFEQVEGSRQFLNLIDGLATVTEWNGNVIPETSETALTTSARKWLGLLTDNGTLSEKGVAYVNAHYSAESGGFAEVGVTNLATCNDTYHLTFEQIADLIEADGLQLAHSVVV